MNSLINKAGINFKILFLSLFITIILIFIDQNVNSNRLFPWEIDDVLSYIIKKEQFQNCFTFYQSLNCDANLSIKDIFNFNSNKTFVETIFFGRTILEYHILYTLSLYILDILINNNFKSFIVLNYISSFFLIFYLNKIILLFSKLGSYSNKALYFIILIFYLSCLNDLLLLRSASKLSIIFFLISLYNLLSLKSCNSIKIFVFSIIQILSHPIGIVTSVIFYLSYFFKNLFNSEKKKNFPLYLNLIFLILSLIFSLYLINNPFIYVDLNNLDLNYLKKDIYESFTLNISSIFSYLTNLNLFYKISLISFIVFFIKKGLIFPNNLIVLNLISPLIIFFSLININPTREIISYLNLIILLTLYINLILSLDLFYKKIKKKLILNSSFLLFSLLITLPTLYNDLKIFNLRDSRDSVNFSIENPTKLANIIKKETIYFSSSNNNLLLYYLSGGLLKSRFIFSEYDFLFHKLDQNELKNINFGVFDLFNNSNSISRSKNLYNHDGRSKSNLLYSHDSFKIVNKEEKVAILELYSSKASSFFINDKKQELNKNSYFKIEIPPKAKMNFSNLITKGYLKINSIIIDDKNLSWPFKKKIELEVFYNNKQSRKIIFNEINPFKGCKVIEFLKSNSQDIISRLDCQAIGFKN